MMLLDKNLTNKTPDITGENTEIYFLDNNLLLKKFKKLDLKKEEYLLKKYEYAKKIGRIEGLSLPIDIFNPQDRIEGFIEEIIPGTLEKTTVSFEEYWKNSFRRLSLIDINKYMLQVIDIVDKCHKVGIINPDLSGNGNVLFDKRTQKVYMTDYHDMQVLDIPSNNLSKNIYYDTILYSPKYKKNGLWTNNIDLFTLAIRYLYYTTGYNILMIENTPFPAGKYLEIINNVGLWDTKFKDLLLSLYDNYSQNLELKEAILELEENYYLEPIKNFEIGQIRKFKKKDA